MSKPKYRQFFLCHYSIFSMLELIEPPVKAAGKAVNSYVRLLFLFCLVQKGCVILVKDYKFRAYQSKQKVGLSLQKKSVQSASHQSSLVRKFCLFGWLCRHQMAQGKLKVKSKVPDSVLKKKREALKAKKAQITKKPKKSKSDAQSQITAKFNKEIQKKINASIVSELAGVAQRVEEGKSFLAIGSELKQQQKKKK
mgnify:CR=1 FL=1